MNTTAGAVKTGEVESSDSSMVDEYAVLGDYKPEAGAFRFLYGRWIQTRIG